jgi:hypothetical protein
VQLLKATGFTDFGDRTTVIQLENERCASLEPAMATFEQLEFSIQGENIERKVDSALSIAGLVKGQIVIKPVL